MNESSFIKQNIDQWQELEDLLASQDADPLRLHDLFVKVSSDFAYARTYFPNRSVRVYLNELTQRVFSLIHKKKNRFRLKDFSNFYTDVLPREIIRNRWAFIVSFVVFALAMLIGILSTIDDPEFIRSILGDRYVEMTRDNIDKGDPMAVYKTANQVDMFLGITVNNIRVALNAYVMGLFASVGTLVILVYNGVMLGSFQYFFYSEELFVTSTLTIWIHGTLEISAIIIAGAAGIILGQGALMPGTLKRSTSFRIKARQSLNILLSTIPLFIVAGFLEGFVTRMTEWPSIAKILIILSSLSVILFFYVIYPIIRRKQLNIDQIDLQDISYHNDGDLSLWGVRNYGHNLANTILFLGRQAAPLLKKLFVPVFMIFLIIYRSHIYYLELIDHPDYYGYDNFLQYSKGGILYYVLYILLFAYIQMILGNFFNEGKANFQSISIKQEKRTILPYLFLSTCWVSGWYFINVGWSILFFAIVSPHFIMLTSHRIKAEQDHTIPIIFTQSAQYSFNKWFHYFLPNLSVFIFGCLMFTLYNSALGQFLLEYLLWHEFFGSYWTNSMMASNMFQLIIMVLSFIIAYVWIVYTYYSYKCKAESPDLLEKLKLLEQK